MSDNNYPINFTDPLKSSFLIRPYTTDGGNNPIDPALDPRAVSAHTSLLMYGKGTPGYGERIQENILHLLENFSGATEPLHPIEGQIWYSTEIHWIRSTDNALYVWDNNTSAWVPTPIQNATVAPSLEPGSTDPVYWYDSVSATLYFWSSKWIPRIFKTGSVAPSLSDTPLKNIKVYDGTAWQVIQGGGGVIAGDYVDRSGDTMHAGAVLQISSSVWLNEGDGNINTGPDLRMASSGLVTASDSLFLQFDDQGTSGGNFFSVGTGARTVSGATELFRVLDNGIVREMATATNYIGLMSDDRDIPNKKYVDDLVSGVGDGVLSGGTFSTGVLTLNRSIGADVTVPVTDNEILFAAAGFSSVNVHDAIVEAAGPPAVDRIVVTSAGGTVFTAPVYTIGNHTLWVFVNGVKQYISDSFAETSSTSITFLDPVPSGSKIEMLSFG